MPDNRESSDEIERVAGCDGMGMACRVGCAFMEQNG
jgi:hypothetical protein